MQQSGTKLVLALVSLAFLLGVTSWWYRYEAVHRATQFWGPEASRLIAESERIEAIRLDPDSGEGLAAQISTGKSTDLSRARGQAHLRHAFLSDRNYVWDEPLDTSATEWRWCLRFHEGERQVFVLLSEDLDVIGNYPAKRGSTKHGSTKSGPGAAYSCAPMAASLKQYFEALGLLAKPRAAATASIGAE